MPQSLDRRYWRDLPIYSQSRGFAMLNAVAVVCGRQSSEYEMAV